MSKAIPKAKETDYPEVIDFLQKQAAIEEYKQMHADVFEQFDHLVDEYNTSLENAEKVVRSAEVNCGPFDLYQYKTTYNAEALFNAVGRDKFLELGGLTGTKVTYDIDKNRFEAAVAAKKVGKDIIAQVRKESPAFHTPKKLVIP
jgi:hypothetical protein